MKLKWIMFNLHLIFSTAIRRSTLLPKYSSAHVWHFSGSKENSRIFSNIFQTEYQRSFADTRAIFRVKFLRFFLIWKKGKFWKFWKEFTIFLRFFLISIFNFSKKNLNFKILFFRTFFPQLYCIRACVHNNASHGGEMIYRWSDFSFSNPLAADRYSQLHLTCCRHDNDN